MIREFSSPATRHFRRALVATSALALAVFLLLNQQAGADWGGVGGYTSPAVQTLTPTSSDTDGDGIPNSWESANFLNGLAPKDALSDFDMDGLTALQEYQLSQTTTGQFGKPLGKWTAQLLPKPTGFTTANPFVTLIECAGNGIILARVQGTLVGTTGSRAYPYIHTPANGNWVRIEEPAGFSGVTGLYPLDVNSHGQVVGYFSSSAGTKGFVWTPGPAGGQAEVFELQTSGGAVDAIPKRISDVGYVVGAVGSLYGRSFAAALDGEEIEFPGSWVSRIFHDVNNYGEFIGRATNPWTGSYDTFLATRGGPVHFIEGGEQFHDMEGMWGEIPDIDINSIAWEPTDPDFSWLRGWAVDRRSDQEIEVRQSYGILWESYDISSAYGGLPVWYSFPGFSSLPGAVNDWGEFSGSYSAEMFGVCFDSEGADGLVDSLTASGLFFYNGKSHFTGEPLSIFGISNDPKVLLGPPFTIWSGSMMIPVANLMPPGFPSSFTAARIADDGRVVLQAGTSLYVLKPNQDADGDGMPDDWEKFHGLNPNSAADRNADPDGDGITNLTEFRYRTDPTLVTVLGSTGQWVHLRPGIDSDGDGLPDVWEWKHGLDYNDASDAYLDSDGDGLTEFQEFLLGCDPELGDSDGDGLSDGEEIAHGSDPLGDAYSADTNGNGVPDGEERDSDQDGVFDRLDASKWEKPISWMRNGGMRFAWFDVQPPADGSKTPMQVNDQGKVLFEKGVWHNGVIIDLPEEGGGAVGCRPLALGDSGTVLGTGGTDLPGDTRTDLNSCMVMWPSGGGAQEILKQGDLYPNATYAAGSGLVSRDMLLNGEDAFVAMTYLKTSDDSGGYYLKMAETNPRKAWKIGAQQGGSGNVSSTGDAPVFAEWRGKDSVFWGLDPAQAGRFTTGSGQGQTHGFDGKFTRAVPLPHGVPAVFKGYASHDPLGHDNEAIPAPQFRPDNIWTPVDSDSLFSDAADFSTEGRFAICRYSRIWHNGMRYDVREFGPGLGEEWKSGPSTRLLDTTRHGWTLAVKKNTASPPVAEKAMLGTPLVLETQTPSQGLDAVSFTLNKSTNANLTGSKEEFWIMVPAGGNIAVGLSSGACAATPLSLGGGPGAKVTASPSSVSVPSTTVTFSAPLNAAGTEESVAVKLANQPSLTVPLRAKIMKPRVVALSVWPIKNPTTQAAPPLPTKAEFEEYLDGIFKKQLNVTFNVTIEPAADSGLASNTDLLVADPPSPTQLTVSAGKKAGNIQLYVMGGVNFLYSADHVPATGLANPDSAFVWMPSDAGAGGTLEQRQGWMNTVAHEIGHVFFKEGHPNDGGGQAPLPGTDHMIRLMHNGLGHVGGSQLRRLCVKAEWDQAEIWLGDNIPN